MPAAQLFTSTAYRHVVVNEQALLVSSCKHCVTPSVMDGNHAMHQAWVLHANPVDNIVVNYCMLLRS